jgi:tRNA G10  N-methylase Trm11
MLNNYMKDYLCILGRHPTLSVLELIAYCKRKNIQHHLHNHNSFFAHITLEKPLNIEELGGITKIAEQTTLDKIIITKNKINFAVTTINAKDMLPQLKTLFKQEKVKATQRYTSTNNISPTQSSHLDLELFNVHNKLYKVISVSQPKAYKSRDEKRPSFDPLKVTSIRLAKILINLAEAQQEIVDPFCGNGTILQEAALMGYKVIGIDTNTSSAKKNMRWLGKEHRKKATFLKGDAPTMINTLHSIETVVTEPYLGPYLRKLPQEDEAQRIINNLTKLYTRLLSSLAKKITGKIVIIIPKVRTYKKTFSINMTKILKETGFSPSSPVPSIKLPLPYDKKRSRVERDIYILERLK